MPYQQVIRPIGGTTLKWNTPITASTLGQEPHPQIAGKRLSQIINSEEVARADNRRCSVCHNQSAPRRYRPNVSTNQVTPGAILPATQIPTGSGGTYRWSDAGASGIVQAFRTTNQSGAGPKPQYLIDALQKWLQDGAQDGQ